MKRRINRFSAYQQSMFNKYEIDESYLQTGKQRSACLEVLEQIDRSQPLDEQKTVRKVAEAFRGSALYKKVASCVTVAALLAALQSAPAAAQTPAAFLQPPAVQTGQLLARNGVILDRDSYLDYTRAAARREAKTTSLHLVANQAVQNAYEPPGDTGVLLDGDSDVAVFPQGETRTLTVIDTDIKDWEVIRDAVREGEVLLLGDGADPLDAILARLREMGSVGCLNIVSHGNSGKLEFDSGVINAAALEADKEAWAEIGGFLSGDGDIQLFGCNVARGETGKAFIEKLAQVTGADVAASVNPTGAESKGGDWTLEAVTGDVAGNLPFSKEAVGQFTRLLFPDSGEHWMSFRNGDAYCLAGVWDEGPHGGGIYSFSNNYFTVSAYGSANIYPLFNPDEWGVRIHNADPGSGRPVTFKVEANKEFLDTFELESSDFRFDPGADSAFDSIQFKGYKEDGACIDAGAGHYRYKDGYFGADFYVQDFPNWSAFDGEQIDHFVVTADLSGLPLNTMTLLAFSVSNMTATVPAITFGGIGFSADTGTSGSDFITNTAAQSVTAALSAALTAGDKVYGSVDDGVTWTDITAKVSGTALTWDGVTLAEGGNTLQLKVTNAVGTDGAVASQDYTLDTTEPDITFSALAFSADTGSSDSDFITATAVQTITATLSATLDAGDRVYGSLDSGVTWANITAKVSGTALTWDGVTLVNGSNTLTLKVTDAAGNDGAAASQAYTLDTTALNVTTTTLPDGRLGTAYSQTLAATGNTPITWTISSGSLPDGLTLDSATGVISGTPTGSGMFNFTVRVTNAADNATQALSIVIHPALPTVTSVTVNPSAVSVQKGNMQVFTSTVSGTNDPEQTVTWSVYGNDSLNTAIYDSGLLTVAVDETAVTLTVTATSTVDNSKSGTATVTVTTAPLPEPTVTSVTVSPSAVSVQKGNTQTFIATVSGMNDPAQTVTWSVYGNSSLSTAIYDSGLLTVAIDETAATLTVTATSTADNSKSGTATVTVTTAPITTYTITASAGSGGSISPSGAVSVTEGSNQTFIITPSAGYRIISVTVDGVGQGAITAYTFTNVTANHTINVTFTNTDGNGGGRDGGSDSNTPAAPAAPTTPTTPAYKADVTAGSGIETTLSVTVNKDNRSASVDIGSQKLASGGTVITIPPIPGVDTYSVGISLQELSTTGEQGTLTLNTGAGSVTVPSNMLTGISGISGSKAEITIGQGDKSGLPEDLKAAIGDRPLIQLTLSIDGKQIDWSNPGARVTVSIPYTPLPAELANLESIIIWHIDGSGNVVTISNGRYDAATGMVTFDTSSFSDFVLAYNKVNFNDVAADAWYNKAVSFIAAREITSGTGNRNYSPNAKLTRGDFIVLMMRAYDIAPDANPTDNFSDSGDTYYTGYLAAAKRLGISGGVGNNLFAPGREITRQEMFTLLYNALKVMGQLPQGEKLPDSSSGKALDHFTDAGQIDAWAKEAMTLLVRTGAIGGSAGKLTPTGTATRAEMAQVLYNLLRK